MVEQAGQHVLVERSVGWRVLANLAASRVVRALGLYAGAGVSYVAIGVFFNPFMLSWVVGFAWLQLWVWVVPALFRRLRS